MSFTTDRFDSVWYTDFKLKNLNWWTRLVNIWKGLDGTTLPVPFGLKKAEKYIANTGAKINHRYSHRMFIKCQTYNKMFSLFPTSWQTEIFMPLPELYTGDKKTKQKYYYYALFHELTHWTGSKERLNRRKFFGNDDPTFSYAAEEIVATLGVNEHLKELGLYDEDIEKRSLHYMMHYLNDCIDGLNRAKQLKFVEGWTHEQYYENPEIISLLKVLASKALESKAYLDSLQK
jgi:hypothetical protein